MSGGTKRKKIETYGYNTVVFSILYFFLRRKPVALPLYKNVKFLKFDIVSFYPSISEYLVDKSLQFASNYTIIKKNAQSSTAENVCYTAKIMHG